MRAHRAGGMIGGIRLWGAIGAVGVLVAAGLWLAAVLEDRQELRAFKAQALACDRAVALGQDTTAACPQATSDAATRSQRYTACDAALRQGDAYAVRAACSAAVKVRDAQASALAADKGDLTRQLTEERSQLTGALARAAARFETLQRKDRNAQAALAAAPRAADGRITCDDQCLRDLTGN